MDATTVADEEEEEEPLIEKDRPRAKCLKCGCTLSQSTLRMGYPYCSPCRRRLEDEALEKGEPKCVFKKIMRSD